MDEAGPSASGSAFPTIHPALIEREGFCRLRQALLIEMQRRLPTFFDDLCANYKKEQEGWNKPADSPSS